MNETQGLSETNPHFPNIPMDTNNDNGPDSGKSRKELDVTLAHEDSPEQVYLRQGESESANRASAAAKVMDTTDGNDTDSRKQGKQLDVTLLTEPKKPKSLLIGKKIIDKTRRELGLLEIEHVCNNGSQKPHYHVRNGDFKGVVYFEDAEECTGELMYIYKDKDGKDIYIDSWVDSPRGMDKVKHLYISGGNLPCIAGVVSGAHLCSDVKVVERCVPPVTVNPFSEKEGNSPEQSAGPSTSVAESCKEAILSFAANNKIDLPTAISMVSTLIKEHKISFFSAEVKEIPQGMDVAVGDIVAVYCLKLAGHINGALINPETYKVEVTAIDDDLKQYSGIARRNTESVDVIFCRNDIAGYYPPLTEAPAAPKTYQGPLRWVNHYTPSLEDKLQQFVKEYMDKAYPPPIGVKKEEASAAPPAPENEPTFPFLSEKDEYKLGDYVKVRKAWFIIPRDTELLSADIYTMLITDKSGESHYRAATKHVGERDMDVRFRECDIIGRAVPVEGAPDTLKDPNLSETSAAPTGKLVDILHKPAYWGKLVEKQEPSAASKHLKFKDDLNTILSETETLLTEKNLAYGGSALNPVGIFQKNVSVKYGLGVRIDDKLSRIMRGNTYPGDNDIDDLIGYLVLLKIATRREEQTDE